MKKAARLLEAGLFIILSVPLAILPLKWSMRAGEALGLLLFYLWGSRRRTALENLRSAAATGSISLSDTAETVIRDDFRNLGRSFIEVLKIYYGFGRKVLESVDLEGAENFREARSKGKGILYLTGHCGNWELLAIVAGMRLSPMGVVARPMNNPYLNSLIEKVRRRYGNSVIYKRGALKSMVRTFKGNGCVGILMDQAVVPDEGYVIDFLGRGAWTTKMPALIARKTGAAALPAFIHRTDEGHMIKIYPEVELSLNSDTEEAVKEDTIRFSGFVEDYIREHPSEWLWIHRRWKRVKQD
jgi:KDO2-lipid IV(A) lauroyltransferase